MRFTAIVPLGLSLAAFILSMLSLFAGSRKGFMEDYAVVTLNSSEIGQNIFNQSSLSTNSSSDNFIVSWLTNLMNSIETEIEDLIEDEISSTAKAMGIHDWYSAHILDYCEGYYSPAAVANATVSSDEIHKNITHCSNRTAFFNFQPAAILQKELGAAGLNINLTDLDWPSEITDGIQTLRSVQKAAFVLYCIAAGLLALAAFAALTSVFLTGRLTACIDVLICSLAFTTILIASALTTTAAIKIERVINKYGKHVGVVASKGDKFLVLTWVATGLAFLDVLVWTVECIMGRRRRRAVGNDNDSLTVELKNS